MTNLSHCFCPLQTQPELMDTGSWHCLITSGVGEWNRVIAEFQCELNSREVVASLQDAKWCQ